MSLSHRLLVGSALALSAVTPAAAQAPKVSGLVQVWYNQMLDSNLRINSELSSPFKYYNLRGEYKENGFAVRRTELKFAGTIVDGVDYEVMIDPSINNNGNDKNILLQDAVIKYTPFANAEIRLGQFKNQQTLEGLTSSGELLFVERSQLARFAGDVRDRGVTFGYTFGDPKGFAAKFVLGLMNGAGKANDANARKDFVGRLEMNLGRTQKFGLYTLQGGTDLADKMKTDGSSNLLALGFAGTGTPSAVQVLDNKDRTTNLGAYYEYKDGGFYAAGEYVTGMVGRRFASLGTSAGNAARQHLDQKFTGLQVTGGYRFGSHTLLARYDTMNYNSGDQWYTTYNPYTHSAPGTALLANGAPVDYTPKYTETTVGYLYAFKPDVVKAASIKVNYIMRSKNFLKPNANPVQTGAQGGDTLSLAFQVGF